MSGKDRRKHNRAKLEQLAEVGRDDPETGRQYETMGGVADVSTGGVRFEARQGFDRGSRVSISLAMNEELVEAKGNVVRFLIQEDGTVSMGIEFCDLSEESRKAIEEYCKKQGGKEEEES